MTEITHTNTSEPEQFALFNDMHLVSNIYPYRTTFWFTVFYLLISIGRIHLLIPVLMVIPSAMIFGILAVIAFIVENGKVREKHVWGREAKLVLALLVICIVTLPTSIWPGGSVTGLYKGFLPMVVLMVITAIICRSAKDIKKFVWLLLAINILIIYFVLSKDITHISKGITDTYDTNDIAMILDCSLPIFFYFMLSCRGIKKIILAICIVLLAITVVKTASRGGMLGLIAFGGYLVWYSRARFKYFMVAVVAVVCFLYFAPQESKERFSTMINPQTEYDQNLGDRTQTWKPGLKLFLKNPVVGVGFGNYVVADGSMKEAGAWRTAHNSLLQIAVELGAVGLVVFVMLSAGTFLKFHRLRLALESGYSDHELLWIVRGVELSLLVYMVTAFFLSQAYSSLFYYIISLSIAAQKFLPPVRSQVAGQYR